jgi:type II secretory pathway component PulK
VIVLSLVAYSLAYEMQMEVKLTTMRRDGLVAYELARIGMARGIVNLKNDLILDSIVDEKDASALPLDGPGDIWRIAEDNANVEVGETGRYTVIVRDEESLLNLNNMRVTQVRILQQLIVMLGERDSKAGEIAEAIFDWMDPDDRPFGGQGESEVDYYSEQIARSQRINWSAGDALVRPKNDFFITLEELLMVPGVTPELFYGYDPRDEKQVEKRESRIAKGGDVDPGLRDFLTVSSGGTLNVNTAKVECLAGLIAAIPPNTPSQGMALAKKLQKHVGSGDENPNNENAFHDITELELALGPEWRLVFNASGGFCPMGFKSGIFYIESVGEALDQNGNTKVSRRLGLVASRTMGNYVYEESLDDIDDKRFGRETPEEREKRKKLQEDGGISIPNIRAYRWMEN